ncbi:hypothetical protein [Frigoribacterium sp. CFBP 13707]|uniref:hypothetical protein n=1 Tax=Frigoribacterium sp. CFBP 13707 TaxID=2775313 RepID=UPI00177AF137|nr:hypothetical protein [Frigoribacterium sp. CFBP 13707]MBD8728883.1 hypothetical protein [Frigoribacterium sp. CFBP 13707]
MTDQWIDVDAVEPEFGLVAVMWAEYSEARLQGGGGDLPLRIVFLDGRAAGADEPLAAVFSGGLRARATLAASYLDFEEELPAVDDFLALCDSSGMPAALVRTTEVHVGPLSDVPDWFVQARLAESANAWQSEQRAKWADDGDGEVPWSEGDNVVFERFEVVWPVEHADS